MTAPELIEDFADLFNGLQRAYGTYNLRRSKRIVREGMKITGKPATVHKKLNTQLWKDHLEGRNGLGIIPIRDDSTCYFGAIDIDVYSGLDIKKIFSIIEKNDIPLIPCRTKSGGLHLYCFTNEPVPAPLMKEKLSVFAAVLGFGDSEIFPKQSEILSERGDIGQWINVPYFNEKETDRYAYSLRGKKLKLKEFILLANKKRFTEKELDAFTLHVLSDISNGPPCLQYLISQGFSPGTRNDGLFNIALYLKKSNPDEWEDKLDSYNERYFNPPLSSSEVMQVVKSIRNKDYNYTCDKPPIKGHCNLTLCRTREHGIGQLCGMPQLTGLTKFDSMPPVWFLDVDGGGRIELSTEDLQSQQRFQRRCMEALNIMPPAVKAGTWQSIIQGLLESATIIEAPRDASNKGLLFQLLERFCTSRVQAKNKDEILMGKPWTDEGSHYFRISDFMSYLEKHRFREFKVNKIAAMFRDAGGEGRFFNLKGVGVNVWKMPVFDSQSEKFDVPEFEEDNVF